MIYRVTQTYVFTPSGIQRLHVFILLVSYCLSIGRNLKACTAYEENVIIVLLGSAFDTREVTESEIYISSSSSSSSFLQAIPPILIRD